jgi:hypothetical protein
MHEDSYVLFIHAPSECGIFDLQKRSAPSAIPKMIECHSGVVRLFRIIKELVRPDSDPSEFTTNALAHGLWPNSSNADDGVIIPSFDGTHAVVIPKHAALRVRIAGMGPFID